MDYKKSSRVFRALGHPVRLAILQGLRTTKGCNVNEMVRKLDLPQSTVSQHLGLLRSNGIIEPRKDGVRTCYQIVDTRISRILDVFKE
jgi:DNA-binding transcriptional ArsR family regulator